MPLRGYRVLFRDVLSGIIHGELPAEKITFTNTLNAPGSASVVIALDTRSRHVNALTVVTGAATALYVERDKRVVWAGLLWDASADFAAGTLTLECEGWLSYFRLRGFHATRRFDQVDQADIARELLRHAGEYGDGSRLGMIAFGSEKTGVLRDRTYKQSEHSSIGGAVEQLAAVNGGFDFSFTTEWRGDDLTTTFKIAYPAVGRTREITLAQGLNCDITSATISGKSVVTHAFATGAGDGPEQVWASSGSPSPIHPRLESVDSYSDIKEYDTLKSKADRRVRLGRAPIVLPTISLYPDSIGLDEIELGDAVAVAGGSGLVPISGLWRVTELAVTVGESGSEDIQITAAPREVFGEDG
ncbi:uncharacterized protein with GYD domain [Actinokineospora baliensis]|uniref:hypothetical protein n=1 Tax=Actinokineospora baliensis TaxID=547056 RepID=UPI001957C15C|nr:hypothetical protein [Actinokineospora baliensis]MBM7770893.1 uncharacterized protein with GYD domain [Actinokineospora baliensis]